MTTTTTTPQCPSEWPNMTFLPISDSEANGLGSFYFISFIIALPLHILYLLASVRHPKIFLRPANYPEVGLMLGGLGVLGLHPFSGAAAFAKKWIWGRAGCQVYGFFGLFFGTFQLYACCLTTVARYNELIRTTESRSRGAEDKKKFKKAYVTSILLTSAFALFWSLCPAFGWASYNLTPVGVICLIDWAKNNTSFVTFVVGYAIFNVIIPFAVTFLYTVRLLSKISKLDVSPIQPLPWARRKCAYLVTMGCAFCTFVSYAGFAGVCLFCIVSDPSELSVTANLLPSPMAKMAGVLNALFFVYMNPTVWAAVKKMFGCQYNANLLEEDRRGEPQLRLRDIDETKE